MYENGNGVEKDESEAMRWYRKAAVQGCSEGKKSFDRLIAKINRFEAEKLSKELDKDVRRALDIKANEEISVARAAMDRKDWDTAYRKYSLAAKHLSDNKDTITLRKECAQGMAEARYQAGRAAYRNNDFKKALDYAFQARSLRHPRAQALIDVLKGGDAEKNKKRKR